MHEVVVASFDLDRTEIRTRDYVACMTAGACSRPHEDTAFCNTAKDASGDRGDHPVNCVDARQAEAYCAFAGKRLPSEREWEYAARGGAEERRYSWGEEEPDAPSAPATTHIGTCPVASFPPGAFGLHDMSGNVWEWTSTAYGAYPDEPRRSAPTASTAAGAGAAASPSGSPPPCATATSPTTGAPPSAPAAPAPGSRSSAPPRREARDGACVRTRGTPRLRARARVERRSLHAGRRPDAAACRPSSRSAGARRRAGAADHPRPDAGARRGLPLPLCREAGGLPLLGGDVPRPQPAAGGRGLHAAGHGPDVDERLLPAVIEDGAARAARASPG